MKGTLYTYPVTCSSLDVKGDVGTALQYMLWYLSVIIRASPLLCLPSLVYRFYFKDTHIVYESGISLRQMSVIIILPCFVFLFLAYWFIHWFFKTTVRRVSSLPCKEMLTRPVPQSSSPPTISNSDRWRTKSPHQYQR